MPRVAAEGGFGLGRFEQCIGGKPASAQLVDVAGVVVGVEATLELVGDVAAPTYGRIQVVRGDW